MRQLSGVGLALGAVFVAVTGRSAAQGAPAPADSAAPPPAAAPAAPPAAAAPPTPAPAAAPAAEPAATAKAEVSLSGASASVTGPSEAEAASTERRVVTFSDGDAPALSIDGPRDARGDVVVELRFENTSPLCNAYTTNLAADHGIPASAGGASDSGAAPVEKVEFSSVADAERTLGEARAALDAALRDARDVLALDGVWSSCGDAAGARARVEAATRAIAERRASWLGALGKARAVADAAQLVADAHSAPVDPDEVVRARREVTDADKAERTLRDRIAAAKGPAKTALGGDLDRAIDAAQRARRDLSDAEARLVAHRSSRGVQDGARSAREAAREGRVELAQLFGEVERAALLMRRAPATVTRTLHAGESIDITVTRTPLLRGVPIKALRQSYRAPRITARSAVWLDLGFGPALTFANTRSYGLGVGPTGDSPVSRTRVTRTEDSLNVDGMIYASMYVWGPRYFDDRLFEWKQLLPRPMVGLSTAQMFSSLYAGLSVDPIRFVDISGGVRWYKADTLRGPAVGSVAATNEQGEPAQPAVVQEIRRDAFVSLSLSTNVIWSWLER